jgi:HlyD family secretion protein
MRQKKKLFWIIGMLGVLIGGFFVYRTVTNQKKNVLRFETARIERGPVIAKVTASGTLSALVTVQVGSQVSGRIKELFVDFNSPVTKGQVIARIDPQLFQAALAQARANYLASQGDLKKAKAQAVDAEHQFQRNKSLAERKLIAQADLDTSQANADAAKAQVDSDIGKVEQARAALYQAEVNLQYTTIVAPINGVVISRSVDVGQTVAASLQTPTLFTIAEDLRKMQVDTSVAEADVGKIQAGMMATFTVDAYPNETFTGTVRQIRNAAQTVQNVVTYDAVIDVANPDLKLRPGMTANATFIYAEKQDILRIPNAALRFHPTSQMLPQAAGANGSPPSGQGNPGNPAAPSATSGTTKTATAGKVDQSIGKTIWVLTQGESKSIVVKTGITDGTLTEVSGDNIREGDQVIIDVLSGGDSTTSTSSSRPSGGMGMRRMF